MLAQRLFLPPHHHMGRRHQPMLVFNFARSDCGPHQKYSPPSTATTLGYVKQQYKNTQSTKVPNPTALPQLPKTQNIFIRFILTEKIFTDQTGAFPHASSFGCKYLMVMYFYNLNGILVQLLKTKNGQEHLEIFTKIHNLLQRHGLQPKYLCLDSEAPEIAIAYLQK